MRKLLPLLAAAFSLFSVSCAPRYAVLDFADGSNVRFTPQKPRIGDPVEVVYRSGTSGAGIEILAPAGDPVAPSILDHGRSGIESRLYFRVTASGDWFLSPVSSGSESPSKRLLFSVASEAGERTEPVAVDAQKLYEGNWKPDVDGEESEQ
ncbi:MAG TPA: hypothetical protein PKH40_10095 [Treponemataceae bacterium]|nr:hypothetical protein [Treponemataceae bacterium]HQL33777.1 hypothetical protein [Treponemataceae bacterium]